VTAPDVPPFEKESLMKILLTEDQLREGVRRLAGEIQNHYGDQPLTIVGVLMSSVVLVADLVRLLSMPLRMELVQARYDGSKGVSLGPLAIDEDLLSFGVRSRHVLLVDDVFHAGHTLGSLLPQIDDLGPKSIRSAVLLEKEGQSEVEVRPDFVGFKIANDFVVGYGIDYRDRYRNLPYVAALEPHELDAPANG
jgi:hypoxanthine phosphoribosyltransferase